MTAAVTTKPPIITVILGVSLIPNTGNQTHKMPPTTSISDNKANSAEGKYFAPKLYKINPDPTNVPCSKLKYELILGIVSKGSNEKPKIIKEKIEQKIPARTTVVNFGVVGFHLIVTVYKAKPEAEIRPIKAPSALPSKESL